MYVRCAPFMPRLIDALLFDTCTHARIRRRLFGEDQEARLARLAKAEAEAATMEQEDHFALAADYQTVCGIS